MFLAALVVADHAARAPGAERYDVVILAERGAIPAEFAAWHSGRGEPFQVVEVDTASFLSAGTPATKRFPPMSLFRHCLPEMLGERYGRILYLDADTEIAAPIDRIFDVDLAGKALAAVDDAGISPLDGGSLTPFGQETQDRLGFSVGTAYANSGVLLMDPAEWQRQAIGRRTLDFLHRHPERCDFMDQDAMNAVLCGDYRTLSPRWNYQSRILRKVGANGLVDPIILHHVGLAKPWIPGRWAGSAASARLYRRFFRGTPWPKGPEVPAWARAGGSPPRRAGRRFEAALRRIRYNFLEALWPRFERWLPPDHARRRFRTYLQTTAFADPEPVRIR